MPEYGDKENELVGLIEILKGDLFDIEIKLQNALKLSRDNLFKRVKDSLERMKNINEDVFKEV